MRVHIPTSCGVNLCVGAGWQPDQGARVPHVVRMGCAGIAVIAIAALTSIGLFAVVAGGLPFGNVSPRVAASGAPVMVTIQALPITPTVQAMPTGTPAPSSLLSGPSGSARTAQAAPTPGAAPSPQPAPQTTSAGASASTTATDDIPVSPPRAASASPAAQASPQPDAPLANAESPTGPASTVTHDGLSLEVVEFDRQWQPISTDTPPPRGSEPGDILTVHVRFANRSGDVRYVADADVLLVADDGARYAPRLSGPQREPRLLTVPVPANDGLRGWLTYDLPAGTTLRGLQWSPTRPDRPRAEATYLVRLPTP